MHGAVTVTSSSADAGSGVASAQFQISPAGAATWSNLGTRRHATPYAATWDTTAFTDGLYDLRVITTDNVGNALTSGIIADVRVDNTAPTGSITAPAATRDRQGHATASRPSSADGGSGVPTRSSSARPPAPTPGRTWRPPTRRRPYAASWDRRPACADGLYDLRVVTTDKAGNTFTSALSQTSASTTHSRRAR